MSLKLSRLHLAFPVLCALGLAACGGSTDDQPEEPLALSGRVAADLAVSGDNVPGVWTANTSGNRRMGIEFLSSGAATYRRAEVNDASVPAPLATGRWRVVDNVLIFKGANQAGQDECALTDVSDTAATLHCLTVGGPDDGTAYDWYLTPLDLSMLLPGTWVSNLVSVTFTEDGRYVSDVDGETQEGTWRASGIRLTINGQGRCDLAGLITTDDIRMTCLFNGDSDEYLTAWTRVSGTTP